MDKELVSRLLASGKTPRQVARETGYSRTEIEGLARGLAQSRRSSLVKYSTMSLAVLLLASLASYAIYRINREPPDEQLHQAILAAADALPSASTGPSWFIENDVPITEVAFDDIGISEKMTARLNLALSRNASIPEVGRLQKMFTGRIQPTFFTNVGGGSSRITGTDKTKLAEAYDPNKTMEVVLYGRFAYQHAKINRRLLFYDQEWRAFFMAALNFVDEAWFDGIVAHELWHAKMHREGAPSAFQPMYSDLWVSEELTAHGLERDVLNLQTQGQYKQLLNQVAGSKQTASIKGFLVQVTPDDLLLLNRLFKPGLPEEQGQRAAQYLLDLTMTWLNQHYRGKELQSKLIEAYRMLVSPQSTNVKVG